MSKKRIIQVLFLTIAKAFALQKKMNIKIFVIMIKSKYGSQNQKLRGIQILFAGYTVSDLFLSLPLHYFHCQILSTRRLWNFLFYRDPCFLHHPSQFIVLWLSSDWFWVWRWLLESTIKDQYYDFSFNEFLFNILYMRNDIELWSLKLKNLKYMIGTGWIFFPFFSLKLLHN